MAQGKPPVGENMLNSISLKKGELTLLLSFFGIVSLLIVTILWPGTPGWAAINLVAMGEIPPNDFRISHMGPDGSTSYQATNSSVAYNSLRDEYLVVWSGNHVGEKLDPDEKEIYGQRVDASSGSLIGNMLRISYMGPFEDPLYYAASPDVAYNPTRDEFLVVWTGSDNTGVLVNLEFEIWGQSLSYDDHDELSLKYNNIRISDMGPDGNVDYDAFDPAVAYDWIKDQYLVVWRGDDNTPPLVNEEFEIFGQYLYYQLDVLIPDGDEFRISFMGPDGNPNYDALGPDVAYNSTSGDYLVVWSGDHHFGLMDDEFEISGRRIFADRSFDHIYLYSDMGGIYNNDYIAFSPAVTYNPQDDEWLIVWAGNEYYSPISFGEYEIFGQFVKFDVGGLPEIGVNDFRISDMGPDENTNYSSAIPDVAYDPHRKLYLVVWRGSDNTPPLVEGEFEIFGQLIDAESRAEVGYNDFRLSDMGPDGDILYHAERPSVSFSDTNSSFLVVWYGDDNTAPLVSDELEIFGQRYAHELLTFLPLIVK
jgi:hypothetical protein